MQHDDQEDKGQHFQDNFNNKNVAAMDNGMHPVKQRKDHPHLTGMCAIYFVGNVRIIKLTSSTPMRLG